MRLYSSPGNDLTRHFPLIADTVGRLKARTCIIDGEAVARGADGIARFGLTRHWQNNERLFLRAFDLIEFNGDDLRIEPLVSRRATLSVALAGGSGIEFNEHLEHEDAAIVFQHACKFGLEASCSSARIRAMCPAARRTGLSSRIRTRRLSAVRPKRIGENDSHDRLVWDK